MTWWMKSALWLLAATVLFAIVSNSYVLGRDHANAAWSKRWAERDAADERAQVKQLEQVRQEEQRRNEAAQEQQEHAERQNQELRAAVDAGRGHTERVQQQLASLRRAASNSATADLVEATARAALVLPELHSRCVGDRRELAEAFDRARLAGLGCQAQYRSLLLGRE